MAPCFDPSATRIADCFLPSASRIAARRFRSADIWRFIASWISRGGMISRISTVVTFTPQRCVTSSSFARSTSLICSRLARTSSRGMSPITARKVVVAMPWTAMSKFCASVFAAQNFDIAVQGIATTTLRAVIGDIPPDRGRAKREQTHEVPRANLDDATQRWGVKVTTVEIREIIPPREIQDAMNRQMSAERNRRAAILEAEGQKQSAILVAEGSKQAAILEAEGQRQAQILKAEGFALALTKVYESAQTVDAKTMTLQYLEALRALGASPATKFVIPTEFTALAAPLLAFTREGGAAAEKK